MAHWTLDGLESRLKKTFPSGKEKWKQIYSKVHLGRYADDFIIPGRSQSLLVNEVQPLVAQFLRERGLELSAETTRATHIRKGLDFLDFYGLSAQVQTVLERQPYSGHVFVFLGRRGGTVKLL